MQRPFIVFLRTTLVRGLTFLLPIVLIGWLFQKAMGLAGKLAKPAMAMLPENLQGGVVVGAIETALMLLIVAFAAGLLARTAIGQRFVTFLENSLIASLPQFNFVRGIADSVDDSDERHVEVVQVPADAGWAMGFVFEASDAAVAAAFLPSAPQWTSGSVVFAERANIRPAGIGFAQAIVILRKLGVGSGNVIAEMTKDAMLPSAR